MPNENCLANFKCPKCGFEDEFNIEISQMATMTDSGSADITGDNEWTDNSYCRCGNEDCEHEGTVFEFTRDPEAKKPLTTDEKILECLKEALKAADKICGLVFEASKDNCSAREIYDPLHVFRLRARDIIAKADKN